MIQRPNLQRNKCILHGFTRCPFLFVRDNSLSLEWRDECQELLAGSCVYPNWVVRAAVVRHVRRVEEVRDCVCFRVGGCFGCSWAMSFSFAPHPPQQLSSQHAHRPPLIPAPPRPPQPVCPPSAPAILSSSHFGVFLWRSRFRSGIQHCPKSGQKHNTRIQAVSLSFLSTTTLCFSFLSKFSTTCLPAVHSIILANPSSSPTICPHTLFLITFLLPPHALSYHLSSPPLLVANPEYKHSLTI